MIPTGKLPTNHKVKSTIQNNGSVVEMIIAQELFSAKQFFESSKFTFLMKKINFRISTIVLLCVGLAYSPLRGHSGQSTHRIVAQGILLTDALDQLSEQYQVFFAYDSDLLRDVKVEDDLLNYNSLEDAIMGLLGKANLKYELVNSKFCVIYKNNRKGTRTKKKLEQKIRQIEALENKGKVSLQRTNRKGKDRFPVRALSRGYASLSMAYPVSGRVTDENGEPLIGVTILIKGTSTGTTTDFNGSYTLDVPDESAVLILSYTGYAPQEILVGNRSTIDVSMAVDATQLSEVVVVGYGEVNARDLTGAIASVKSRDIVRSNPVQAAAALQGQIAGININKLSNKPGERFSIDIRGLSDFSGSSEPLVVIDGVIGADMNVLNPNDIESIDVLKDASSTAIYGSRGANGVIIITTKRGKSGTPRVTYDAYVGMKKIAHLPTLQTAQEFAKHVFEIWPQETGRILPSNRMPTDSESAMVSSGQSTNWIDLITRNALQTGHTVGLTGGSDRTTYDFSAGFLNEQGNTLNTGFKRYTIKGGIESEINDKIKVGLTSYYTFSKQNLASNEAVRGAFRARPTGTVYTADLIGTDAAGDKDWNGYSVFMGINDNQVINPVVEVQPENFQREQRTSALLASAYIDYEPIQGLSFRSSISTNVINMQDGSYIGNYTKKQKTTRGIRSSLNTAGMSSYTLDLST